MSQTLMKLNEIPKNISWTRRIATTSTWILLALILTILLPFIASLTTIYDLLTQNRFSVTRTAIYFTYFFLLESLGLIQAFGIWLAELAGRDQESTDLANRRLQQWWARGLFWRAVKIFSMNVEIHGLEAMKDSHPALVLPRHASTLDAVLPLAIAPHLKRFRYVIKSELLIAPTLDYAAQRLPNVFVERGGGDPEFEIQKILALATELEQNVLLVLFPEGTRFTESKRTRLLEKFADDEELLALTHSLKRTLPPLREGPLRLLQSTPSTDVVFISHRGIDQVTAMSDLFHGGLTQATLQISIWRIAASDIPRTPQGVRDFLIENWRRVDRFANFEE